MADPRDDPEIREMMERLEREIREQLESQVVGSVEVEVARERYQQAIDRFYEKMNEAPLAVRLLHLGFLINDDATLDAIVESVHDVLFRAVVELTDDPTELVVTIEPRILFKRKVDAANIAYAIGKIEPPV